MSNTGPSPSLESIVCALGLVLGIILSFLTPPFQVADEDSHFKRAFALSQGKLFAEHDPAAAQPGHYFPVALLEFERAHASLKGDISQKYSFQQFYHWSAGVTIDYSRQAFNSYSAAGMHPFQYIPQAAGMWIGRRLGDKSPLTLLHAARLANVLVFWLLIYAALRIAPVGRLVMALLALLPMTLTLAASISYDPPVIGLCFLVTALLLRLAQTPAGETVSRAVIGLCCGLAVLLFENKLVYFGLWLLWFLIPAAAFRSRRVQIASFLAIVGCGAGGHLIWKLLEQLVSAQPFAHPDSVYFQQQLSFILSHPWQYFVIFLRSLYDGRVFYLYGFIGNLGWLDTNFPVCFIALACVALLAGAALERSPCLPLRFWQRGFMLGTAFLAVALFFTAMYLIWTPLPGRGGVGAPLVNGPQGRYFLPIAPLVGAALSGTRLARITWGTTPAGWFIVLGWALLSGVMTVITTLLRYYC